MQNFSKNLIFSKWGIYSKEKSATPPRDVGDFHGGVGDFNKKKKREREGRKLTWKKKPWMLEI